MIPVLMITYNRLEYTKIALPRLLEYCKQPIIVIDNGSEDGTREYLKYSFFPYKNFGRVRVILNEENFGIAYAMNQFLELTKGVKYCIKVDNDTLIPPDFVEKMVAHMEFADLVQAKHKLIDASGVGTFDHWVSPMKQNGNLRYNHFIGGSGIMFKRQVVNRIPETKWKLGGWREFQRINPLLRKAFATDVEIKLLDEHGYQDFPDYYKQTGRC